VLAAGARVCTGTLVRVGGQAAAAAAAQGFMRQQWSACAGKEGGDDEPPHPSQIDRAIVATPRRLPFFETVFW